MVFSKAKTGILIGSASIALLVSSLVHSVQHAETQYTQLLNDAIAARGDDIFRFHTFASNCFIAHGGGTGSYLYTNSQEAVINSIQQGFLFIELDLLITKDRRILGAHDWRYFNVLTQRKSDSNTSLSDALQRKINSQLTPLSAEGIRNLMQQHPDWILVTDKISDFELLLQEIPYPERMIVEVFSAQEYLKALRCGILYPAFSVSHQASLKLAIQHSYPIITIPAHLFLQNIEEMRQLHAKRVCIMVHGTESIDVRAFIHEHLGHAASMIYTGMVVPKQS